jgi:hypothetical protein
VDAGREVGCCRDRFWGAISNPFSNTQARRSGFVRVLSIGLNFAVLQRVIAFYAQGLKIDILRKGFLTQSLAKYETT